MTHITSWLAYVGRTKLPTLWDDVGRVTTSQTRFFSSDMAYFKRTGIYNKNVEPKQIMIVIVYFLENLLSIYQVNKFINNLFTAT